MECLLSGLNLKCRLRSLPHQMRADIPQIASLIEAIYLRQPVRRYRWGLAFYGHHTFSGPDAGEDRNRAAIIERKPEVTLRCILVARFGVQGFDRAAHRLRRDTDEASEPLFQFKKHCNSPSYR